jgi:type II secretory pathway component PulF
MVHAGETGGFLDLVLAQIADFQSRDKELRSKVMAAMLYPCILLVLALFVLAGLLVFFIPTFQTMFERVHGTLPVITQIIIGASHIVRSYGILVVIGVVVFGILIRTWVVSEKGRRQSEALVLRVPVIGPLIAQFAMARFTRMLGTLLGAGVPLVQALNVARKSMGNQILVDAVAQAIERVQQGGRLGASLAECRNLFPSSVLEMISVAEESSRLDQELVRIANVTEVDLDRHLKTAVALAEPLMLFVIAGFIGTIFIGMLLPVFTLQDYIK